MKQLEKCPNWPDTCRNVDCPKRHTGTPSKASKPVPSKPVPQEKTLVSFFWNIENAPIPRGQKPFDIVQRIRQKLVLERGLQEVDFSCYCDTNTISQENQQSLSHATVRIVHVPDRKPGAVDRQIMLDLDRFERTHRPPATIVLISGDIDFFGKLSDLRHQARFRVIVIHNRPDNEELKATVNENYSWELFTEPSQQQQQQLLQPVIRNHSGRSTIQAANVRPVLNNEVNNDYNINGTAPSKSLFDPHSANSLPPNNYIPSTSPAPYRSTNRVTRNPGFTNHQNH
jgi:meiosis arrest female protein 1